MSRDWSSATTITRRHTVRDDVHDTQRGVASFGGGGPAVGDSVREFVRRYGWRAYALPVLLIVTVVALLTVRTPPAGKPSEVAAGNDHVAAKPSASASTPPVAPIDIPLKSDASSGTDHTRALKVGELPRGGPFTTHGAGTYRVIKGTTKVVGTSGRLFRYDIEIENGVKGIDTTQFAALVDKTLDDPRSWSGHGVRLQRVSSGPVDFHVSMTSTMTVRTYCGYDIPVETSCYATAGTGGLTVNRVVFNDARWIRGAAPYVADLAAYRIYMINHEDGHALGHQHAHQCLPGGLAPVMMQQTFGLKSAVTGQNCGANPWPYPPGAKGAPGKEQPDTDQNNEYYIGD
ncbi:MAG TPA: DUF3152 domain-containing protein [Jatrophihabitans sp.]